MKDWGNGVAAVAIVHPKWRERTAPLCIEMLYDPEVLLQGDGSGRRLYLSEEFDRRTGHHESGLVTTPNPTSKNLVREEVHQIGSGNSVALSKISFAEKIERAEPPFGGVEFEGFRGTFDVIQGVTARIATTAGADRKRAS